MSTSFAQKILRITFALSNNAVFQGTNSNKLVLSKLRAVVHATSAGFPAFPEADLQIYGMKQDDMNALVALAFFTDQWQPNTVTVEASSDGGKGWSVVFAGSVYSAQPDYDSAPDVIMRVSARVLFYDSLHPAPPSSYRVATDVATVVENLAVKMGYAFENNGVTSQLPAGSYFANTLGEQLRKVCEIANIDCYIDGQTGPTSTTQVTDFSALAGNVIAICPRGQPRNLPVWDLSPSNGLIGYPKRDSIGRIIAKTYYNPAYRWGGLVDLQDSGIVATVGGNPAYNINTGKWLIASVHHTLEAFKFGGLWQSELLCYPPGSLPP